MKPVSFRGFALNTGGLTSAMEQTYQRPALTPIEVERQGERPLMSGVKQEAWTLPPLGMLIDGDPADVVALRRQILKAFDNRAGAGALVVTDDNGSNERYIYAVCQELTQNRKQQGDGFTATLVAADDVFWRSTATTTAVVTMNDIDKTLNVTNPGDVDVNPTITVAPSVSIGGSNYWRWRRFVAVPWRSLNGARDYPVELTNGGLDTTALMGAGKVSNPNNMAVIVDGVEVDRWYGTTAGSPGGFNSTSTRMWANLDFEGGRQATLYNIESAGIICQDDISGFPPAGVLYIGTEVILYTGRDLYRRAFTGITRGAYGSSVGSPSSGAAVYWLQHEVWLVYSPGYNAKTVDDTRKPLIDLMSANTGWTWDAFGSTVTPTRTAQWTMLAGGAGGTFVANENAGYYSDSWDVIGLTLPASTAGGNSPENYARGQVYLPCGVDEYTLYGSDYDGSYLEICLSEDGANWVRQTITPGSAAGWDGWTETDIGGLTANWRYLAVRPRPSLEGTQSQLGQAQIVFQTALTPAPVLLPEQNNYRLALAIVNTTTNERVEIVPRPGLLQTADSVFIDTDARTAVILPSGRNIYGTVGRDGLRPAALRLVPGVNALSLIENPNANNTVTISFQARWYI